MDKQWALDWLGSPEGQNYLEIIKENAYDNGYRDGVEDVNTQSEWDSGYRQGYQEGSEDAIRTA